MYKAYGAAADVASALPLGSAAMAPMSGSVPQAAAGDSTNAGTVDTDAVLNSWSRDGWLEKKRVAPTVSTRLSQMTPVTATSTRYTLTAPAGRPTDDRPTPGVSSSSHSCSARFHENSVAGVALLLPKANALLPSGDDVSKRVEPRFAGSDVHVVYTLLVVLGPPPTGVHDEPTVGAPGHPATNDAGGIGVGVRDGVGFADAEGFRVRVAVGLGDRFCARSNAAAASATSSRSTSGAAIRARRYAAARWQTGAVARSRGAAASWRGQNRRGARARRAGRGGVGPRKGEPALARSAQYRRKTRRGMGRV